jgi:glycosyltransferase involved in cell wall biosynthesis
MPVRDAAGTVAQQLDGLARQDYAGAWELVVVDDGSTDGTVEIVEGRLRAMPASRLLRADQVARNGASRARNVGAAAAAGDLLAFCDADDVVSTGWLSGIALGASHGDIVGSSLEVTTLNHPTVQRWHAKPPEHRSHALHRFLPRVSSGGCAVWADSFAAVGGFDEQHPGAEDMDFSWRAQLVGYRLHFVDDAVIAYRYRSGLRATAKQEYRWGKADARLFRDFAAVGMKRTAPGYALGRWALTICGIPMLPFSSRVRGRWMVRAARCCGRLVGSVHERVFFP